MSVDLMRGLYDYHRWANRTLYDDALAPCPTATVAITAATPMNTPSIVRAERILFRLIARHAATSAIRANAPKPEEAWGCADVSGEAAAPDG